MKKDQKCSHCANCKAEEQAQIQQRIFEREVDEELRQEHLLRFWKKYRFLILGGVIGVILGTICVEWHQSYKHKISLAESDRFENATILAVQDKTDEALQQLQSLGVDAKTGYRYIAQLEQAGLLLNQNKVAQALEILLALSKDANAPKQIRDVALLSYVGHRLDTGNTAELMQMITPLTQDVQNPFYGTAIELKIWLHLISGEKETAKNLINTALSSATLPPQTQEKLNILLEQTK